MAKRVPLQISVAAHGKLVALGKKTGIEEDKLVDRALKVFFETEAPVLLRRAERCRKRSKST